MSSLANTPVQAEITAGAGPLPPTILRRLVRGCIKRHINPWRLDQLRQVERQERKTLKRIAGAIGPAISSQPKPEAPL